jgi:hypothetical protein
MALFVPAIDPDTINVGSEADVARAMIASLGSRYIVMHSLPWANPTRDDISAPAREGEADFLILHRAHGVLVLEVKGGEIELKGRRWWRHKKNGLEEIKDPVKQASRSKWALRKRVEQICGKALADRATWGTAVAFPHCLYKGEAPADLPLQAVLSMDDMGNFEAALERVYKANGSFKPEMSAEDLEAVRKALAPEFRIYEPLSISLSANEAVLSRLTRQQLQVLRGFETNPRAIIEGVAGSGKTLLAMQRARSFAGAGHNVLFTCFNTELAKWVREEMAGQLVEDGGRITVENFHRLAVNLCKEAQIDFVMNDADPQRWWDEVAPDLLAQAAIDLHGDTPPYSALVVDEAQDFSPGWWAALEYLWDPDGPAWAFLDKAQSLRREPVDPPLANAFRCPLDINCRNTRRIVACANAATQIACEPFETAPLGRPPKIITPGTPNAITGLIQQEIRTLLGEHRLRPNQIAVLGPAAKMRGALASVSAVDGVLLIDDARAWREGNGILITTARSFKGLEADVVVLADFSGLGGLFTVSDLYVALTRARSHLIIVARDRASREKIDGAIAAAVALGSDE